jgi:Uma2 family endonuclease
MSDSQVRTAADYLARLEEGDRWIELVRGRLVRLSPPDERHGNVVRNLAHALSHHLKTERAYYLCFELGLVLQTTPATVRAPAVTAYPVSIGLGELDKLVTETVPVLVVEVASSNDRREGMSERIAGYQRWGVSHVWVFDPQSKHAHVFSPDEPPRMLKETETLTSRTLLPGFSVLVGDLFLDPEWARR